MDTDEKYRESEFYVTTIDRGTAMVPEGETPPPLPREQRTGEVTAPVDGWVVFYGPEKVQTDEPHLYFEFPFRSHKKDDDPWAANPSGEKFSRRPVWKWMNPEASLEDITLHPSLGVNNRDGDGYVLHAWIEDGEVRYV